MKIVLSLCCVTLAMLLHPVVSKYESESSFRIIKIRQTENGYTYFDSMAITSAEDFKALLEEVSRQQFWNNKQEFIDALLNAKVNFNEEALVLLRHDEPYGAVNVSLETPVLHDKTLLCEIRGAPIRGLGLGVIADHCFALVVSKSLVNKVQLNVVRDSPEPPQPAVLLSTTERQPLKFLRQDPPPRPAPASCPKLVAVCPTDLLETGKIYEFKVVVEGVKPEDNVIYIWSVSPGEIVGGQETRSLFVRITKPNSIYKAYVSLGGIDPYCNVIASCSCGPSR